MSYPLKLLKTVWFGIKNNKTLAGFVGLMCIVIMPAFSYILSEGRPLGNTAGIYGCIAAYFCGIIVPIAMFGYLHKGRECEFYTAMPVKKSQYFWGYVIAGFLIFLVPLTLMFVVLSAMGCDGWGGHYLQSIAAFLSLYCSSVLAVVFSGSTASTVVTLIIRNGLAIALVALPLMIAAVDVNAYVELLFRPICILTPVTTGNAVLDPQTDGVLPFQLIAAAVELITAFFLHKFRRNETVTALAFPKSRYFYQYTVMLIFTLGADAMLLLLFNAYDSHYGIKTSGEQFPLVVFLTALVIFISFILMNMVLEKNSKAAFKRIRHFFIFTAGYGILIFAVSGICANGIPPSVLPFTPDSAVFQVYSVKEVPEESDWDFTYYYKDDDDDEYHIHFYREVLEEEFAVISPQKVKELVYYAMHPDTYYGAGAEFGTSSGTGEYFGILPKNYRYPFTWGTGSYLLYDEALPENFTLFTVNFRDSDKYTGAEGVYNYSRSEYRCGFASGTQKITSYKDIDYESPNERPKFR